MRVTNTILRPIVTEKSLNVTGVYTFKVNMNATKGSVSSEVKRLYGVDPVEVRTTIIHGKKRRIPGTPRFRTTPNWKKAIVKLKEGQTIELFNQGK